MSRPVDVLAVIANRVVRVDGEGFTYQDEALEEALAAVAELVEAAKAAGYELRGELTASESLAKAMLDAALAKFGGAA